MSGKTLTPAKEDRIQILIVDDHPPFREGLARLLADSLDLSVCGEVENARETMKEIKKACPDLVILDLSLGKASGLEVIRDIHARFRNLPILVLSMHDEILYAERTLRSGARGYIMKGERTVNLLEAIRKVARGDMYLSERMTGRILRRLVDNRSDQIISSIDSLTNRELDVFRRIGEGMTLRRIASDLYLSVKTVASHREHIKGKLSLSSSSEIARRATRRLVNSRAALASRGLSADSASRRASSSACGGSVTGTRLTMSRLGVSCTSSVSAWTTLSA